MGSALGEYFALGVRAGESTGDFRIAHKVGYISYLGLICVRDYTCADWRIFRHHRAQCTTTHNLTLLSRRIILSFHSSLSVSRSSPPPPPTHSNPVQSSLLYLQKKPHHLHSSKSPPHLTASPPSPQSLLATKTTQKKRTMS